MNLREFIQKFSTFVHLFKSFKIEKKITHHVLILYKFYRVITKFVIIYSEMI